ncbi:MAG: ubiquinol-cytochrome c reductase iron-sulfur subunit [Candidatus Azotimanducaceae bacterium]|jgi:ubiquinol-cytochrome c reductase iron-sulfur subunit
MDCSVDRRTLLTRIVQAFSITGLGFVTYPFIKAWIPSFDNTRSRDVDIASLMPGEQKVVPWLGRNVVLVKRDSASLEALPRSTEMLKDPLSDASVQPVSAKNPYRSVRPDLFVAYTNCTHLGCEVVQKDNQFKCPCHQSDYDGAGRVLEGAAAPRNLDVPNYRYLSSQLIRLEQLDT